MNESVQPTDPQPGTQLQIPPLHRHIVFLIITVSLVTLLASLGIFSVVSQNKKRELQMTYQQPSVKQSSTKSLYPSTPQIPTMTIQPAYEIISTKNISPDGSYTVTEERLGDGNNLTVKDSKGNTIMQDLVVKNAIEIGMNKKLGCQCRVSFKGWANNKQFAIQIVNGIGEEYEFLVDALSGKVEDATFKRIK